jgi:hypothetical protein
MQREAVSHEIDFPSQMSQGQNWQIEWLCNCSPWKSIERQQKTDD